MFTLGVSDHVMIAHSFADEFFGPAQQLHGATYAIEVEVCTTVLGPHHVVMDIGALRETLRAALATLDYKNLDDHPAFPGRTSTTERVAEHIAELMSERLSQLPADAAPPPPATLRVRLRESPVAWAMVERPLALRSRG
ncbi:MAG TPA: 6-carboxytetrahydropterin synthase [Polyangiaceae bacterium]